MPSVDECADQVMARYEKQAGVLGEAERGGGGQQSAARGPATGMASAPAVAMARTIREAKIAPPAPAPTQNADGGLVRGTSSDQHPDGTSAPGAGSGGQPAAPVPSPKPTPKQKDAAVKDASSDQPSDAATDAENKPATPADVTKALEDAFKKNSKPIDWDAFGLLTGVGSAVQGRAPSAYKVDNDYVYSTNVGRKIPEILFGGSFTLPFKWGGCWIRISLGDKSEDCPTHPKKSKTKPTGFALVTARPEEQSATPSQTSTGARTPAPGSTGNPTDSNDKLKEYANYRPWQTFLSVRLAPGADQTLNGFVIGGGYRITKYFSLLVGYSLTPITQVSSGFRAAAAQAVAANPKIYPYSLFNQAAILNDTQGALDGFPILAQGPNGPLGNRIYPGDPLRTQFRSGIYFGVAIPLTLNGLFQSKEASPTPTPTPNPKVTPTPKPKPTPTPSAEGQ